ncbi:uncharacterized protein [Littorina saxatilis]|uniref:uncharacterized protein n=1 Tax=Littorina saxatilis TaxID=31220 RepID=UPI0038B49F3B
MDLCSILYLELFRNPNKMTGLNQDQRNNTRSHTRKCPAGIQAKDHRNNSKIENISRALQRSQCDKMPQMISYTLEFKLSALEQLDNNGSVSQIARESVKLVP